VNGRQGGLLLVDTGQLGMYDTVAEVFCVHERDTDLQAVSQGYRRWLQEVNEMLQVSSLRVAHF